MSYDLGKIFGKPLVSGAAGAIFSYLLMDGSGSVIIMDKIVPGWLLVGVVVTGSTFIGEWGKELLLPHLQGMSLGGFEGSIAAPTITGLSTFILLKYMDTTDYSNFLPAFLLGAGSNIVGDYGYDNWIKNWV